MSRKSADFTYLDQGMFIAVRPENEDAERVWRELAKATDGTGKVFSHHFPALRQQIKRAGYTIAKAPKLKAVEIGEIDALLNELGL